MVQLKFKKLDERAVIPQYAHVGDIGMDVTAIDVEYDIERDVYIYHTGLACEMERGYALLCFCRSSNTKTEAYLPNAVGIVDAATYRGEIQFRYKNRDAIDFSGVNCWTAHRTEDGERYEKENKDILIQHAMKYAPYKVGDRIGQFVIVKVPEVEVLEVDTLSETDRGTGGFGSTGK